MTTAPSEHVCSVVAIERFIAQTGTEMELRGVEPVVLRRVRDRIQARGANAASGGLTPPEAGLAGDVDLINSAHADPAFKELRQRSTRGGDEGLTKEAPGKHGPKDHHSKPATSPQLGLDLQRRPAEVFTFNQAQFRRILIKHLGLAGDVSVPWTHHCGNGATRILTASTINHLEICSMLGRNSAPHNAVRDVLAHMVKLTDAAVVESPVQAADGDSTVADVV